MKALIPIFALCTGLAACAGLGTRLEAPKVSFVGIKVTDAKLFEQRCQVRLKVQNPNAVDLPVDGLDIDVELAGEPFAHGVSAREFTIPARGEAEFDMIVTTNAVPALVGIARGDRKSREAVDYRLTGKLSTRLGMVRSIPFEETGTLSASSLLGGHRKAD